MNTYDSYIETVENLSTSKSSEQEQLALEAAADSLAFVQGLHDTFVAQGLKMPTEPDMHQLEGIIEGYVGELIAACILLSNQGLGSTPEMLVKLEERLRTQVPESVRTGFLRLASRVKESRVVAQKLINTQP